MQPTILAVYLEFSRTAFSMSAAGLALLVISLLAAKNDIAQSRGLDKLLALNNLCFAIPLAVFGAEHLSGARFLMEAVPPYMPWRLFWAYFVGFALIAASLSIATEIRVRWSGVLFGTMMILFIGMLHLPRAISSGDRISWTIPFREMSFAGGGWVLAGIAMGGLRGRGGSLITVGRVLIGITAIFFGVQHFLHPLGLPGVPLEKQMPTWVPARALIDYLTGAFLIAAGMCFLLARKNAHGGHVSRRLDCVDGCGHLRACHGRCAGGPEYRGESRGAQLLRRHASVWGSDSFACTSHDGPRLPFQ
jgi:uncharacterized membrane protein